MHGVNDPRLGARVTVERCADKSAMPVVMAPSGTPFVISEPGVEYNVAVHIESRSPMWRRVPSGGRLQASLTIDGKPVGYNHLLSPSRDGKNVVFDGVCTFVNEYGNSQYKRFMFARLADDANGADAGPTVSDPEAIPAGRMVIAFTALMRTGAMGEPATGCTNVVGGAGSGGAGRLPEGKKFFLAPSMQTAQGRAVARSQSWDTTVYAEAAKLGSIEVRYDSASTLLLRGTLSKANPAHRALLRASRDPGVRALVGDHPPGAAGVKREGGVKRERDDGHEGGGGGSVYLDLTKAPTAPLMVGGRALGADEVAVCDLAGDDDDDAGEAGGSGGGGLGRWEVRKKAAVDVGGEEDVERCADKSAMPVVMAPSGAPFVISEPGVEYNVAVRVEPDSPMWRQVPSGALLKVLLKIDDKHIGYFLWATPGSKTPCTFDGFRTYFDAAGSSQYKRFMFAPLADGADAGPTVSDPEAIPAGRMSITFTAQMATGRTRARSGSHVSGSGGAGRLPEGKKFFLAPSMQTAQGRAEVRRGRVVKWVTVYAEVAKLGSIEVRYDSASTLLLRGTLSKANPAHRALLRASRDPGVRALLGDHHPSNAPGVKREGGVKPEGGVKRERDDGHEGGGGGGSVYLDLTKAPTAPLMVGGRALGADEVAVCDLAGDDDNAAGEAGGSGGGGLGRWEVRKKAAVEVGGDEDVA